jgi:hypothetical protein
MYPEKRRSPKDSFKKLRQCANGQTESLTAAEGDLEPVTGLLSRQQFLTNA